MTTNEDNKPNKEESERLAREEQEKQAKPRPQRSPNQQRLFEKMGMIVKVSKPDQAGS